MFISCHRYGKVVYSNNKFWRNAHVTPGLSTADFPPHLPLVKHSYSTLPFALFTTLGFLTVVKCLIDSLTHSLTHPLTLGFILVKPCLFKSHVILDHGFAILMD